MPSMGPRCHHSVLAICPSRMQSRRKRIAGPIAQPSRNCLNQLRIRKNTTVEPTSDSDEGGAAIEPRIEDAVDYPAGDHRGHRAAHRGHDVSLASSAHRCATPHSVNALAAISDSDCGFDYTRPVMPPTRPEVPQLTRAIGLPQATAIVVGTIIGTSIFVQPSEITREVPTITGILVAWTPRRRPHLPRRASSAPSWPRRFRRPAASTCSCARRSPRAWRSCGAGPTSGASTRASSPPFRWSCARYIAFFVEMSPLQQQFAAAGVIAVVSAINYVGRARPARPCRRRSRRPSWLAVVALLIGGRGSVGHRGGGDAWKLSVDRAVRRAARPAAARHQRRALRLRRLAHGHLHGRRDHRSGAHAATRPHRRRGRGHALLHRVERGLSLRAAARGRAPVAAHRRRRRPGAGRPRRRLGGVGAGGDVRQ